jgi:hypothetical protein
VNVNNIVPSLKQNSPHILTGLAVAGVVTTAYFAAKGAVPAADEIHSRERRNAEVFDDPTYRLPAKEVLRASWRYFIPAGLAGAATIACIIGANTVAAKRQTALIAGATLSQQAFREYREAVIEKIGAGKEEEVRAEIVQRKVDANPPSHEVIIEDNGKTLFFDTWSNRYFYSTREEVEKARNEVNFEVINNSYATMNDFFREVGLPQISMGDSFGWTTTNKMDIYFTAVMSANNRPAIGIDYYHAPIGDYTNPFGK